jgi:hypothetical protein
MKQPLAVSSLSQNAGRDEGGGWAGYPTTTATTGPNFTSSEYHSTYLAHSPLAQFLSALSVSGRASFVDVGRASARLSAAQRLEATTAMHTAA